MIKQEILEWVTELHRLESYINTLPIGAQHERMQKQYNNLLNKGA